MSSQRKFGYKAFARWEVELVKRKAKRLIGKFGFTPEDVGDLEQELLLHIFMKKKGSRAHVRPKPPEKSIMHRMIDNRVRDIIDKAQTKKRGGHFKSESLHRELGQTAEGDSLTYEDVLTEDESLGRLGKRRLAEESEMKSAIGSAFQRLSPYQRKVCRLLMRHPTIGNVANALRLKRPTLYIELKRIREIFDEEGLSGYV